MHSRVSLCNFLFSVVRQTQSTGGPAIHFAAIRYGSTQNEAFTIHSVAPDAGGNSDCVLLDDDTHGAARADHQSKLFWRCTAAADAVARAVTVCRVPGDTVEERPARRKGRFECAAWLVQRFDRCELIGSDCTCHEQFFAVIILALIPKPRCRNHRCRLGDPPGHSQQEVLTRG